MKAPPFSTAWAYSDLWRFCAKFEVDFDTGCWLWATPRRNGYGSFRFQGVTIGAHRAAHLLFLGPIPKGLDVDHLCRIRRCVNPDHLEAVTRRKNLLRGLTIPAARAAVLRCPVGHPYDKANTYVDRAGSRHCRECAKIRQQARRDRELVSHG